MPRVCKEVRPHAKAHCSSNATLGSCQVMLASIEQVFALAIMRLGLHAQDAEPTVGITSVAPTLIYMRRKSVRRAGCRKNRSQQERKDKNVRLQWGRHLRGELLERKGTCDDDLPHGCDIFVSFLAYLAMDHRHQRSST